MAIIPNDEKVFMVDKTTNTRFSGSKATKAMQEWYTMQDVLDTVGVISGVDLQSVLESGNSAIEDINLTGKITTTDFETSNDIYVRSLVNPIRIGKGPGTVNNANTVVGYNALQSNNTGNNNVAIGNLVLSAAANSNQSVAIGAEAMQNATASAENVAIGYRALRASAAANSVAIGAQAMSVATTGTNNTAIGYFSMNSNTTSIWNVAVGMDSLRNNTTGNYNTAIGGKALSAGNTTSG
jgi:hypothetical protein